MCYDIMTLPTGYVDYENILSLLKFSVVKLEKDIPIDIESEYGDISGSLKETGEIFKKMELHDRYNSLILTLDKQSGYLLILKSDNSTLGMIRKKGFFSKQRITMKSKDGEIMLHSRKIPTNRFEILDKNNQPKAICTFQDVRLPNKYGRHTDTRKFDFEILDELFDRLTLISFFMGIFFYMGSNIYVDDGLGSC